MNFNNAKIQNEDRTKNKGAQVAQPTRTRRRFALGAASLGVAIFMLGFSYASVPLYQLFCQATGFGGTIQTGLFPDQARHSSSELAEEHLAEGVGEGQDLD